MIATGNTDSDYSGHVVLATRRDRDRNYERSNEGRFVVASRDERRSITTELIGNYFLSSPSSEEKTATFPQKHVYLSKRLFVKQKKTSDS